MRVARKAWLYMADDGHYEATRIPRGQAQAVIRPLMDHLAIHKGWQGTPSDLLALVTEATAPAHRWLLPRDENAMAEVLWTLRGTLIKMRFGYTPRTVFSGWTPLTLYAMSKANAASARRGRRRWLAEQQ